MDMLRMYTSLCSENKNKMILKFKVLNFSCMNMLISICDATNQSENAANQSGKC